MQVRHAKALVLAALMALSYATAASAVVLWDQSNWDINGDGSVNLSSTSCSQISGNTKAHTACDVHFDNPVHITTIRIYETTGNVQTATQAYLWIAPKTGPLPTTPSDQVNNAANGTLGNLNGGNYDPVAGKYSVTGTADAVTAALHGLIFTPTQQQVAQGETIATSFTITATDAAGASITNTKASVIATAANVAPISWQRCRSNSPICFFASISSGVCA